MKVGGTCRYLFRAINQFGQVIDVFLSPRGNAEAARRFFAQAISRTRVSPTEVTTDRYRVYPRVLDELLPAAFHRTEAHANNSLETDHGRLKARLRPMRGLKRDGLYSGDSAERGGVTMTDRKATVFLVVALVLGLGVLASIAIVRPLLRSEAATSKRPEANPSASDSAQELAISSFEAEYGSVTSIYSETRATLKDWVAAEPSNTSGMGSEFDPTAIVTADFVQGDFQVLGPMTSYGQATAAYDEGRLIFDAKGHLLGVRLWNSSKAEPPFTTGEPAFDPAFDDQ